MRSPWVVLGAALLSLALFGPAVGTVPRAIAAAAWICVLAHLPAKRRALLIAGLALGGLAAVRLDAELKMIEAWQGYEGWAQIEVLGSSRSNAIECEIGALGRPPIRARLRIREEHLADAQRLVARVRIDPWRAVRNPDDRDGTRSRLASGWIVRGRVLDEVLTMGTRDVTRRDRWSAQASTWLDERLGESSALWRALLLADTSQLDQERRRRIRELGLSHLLALSGLHVGVVLGALFWPLRHRGRRVVLWLVPLLVLWLWLAGGGASLSRAVMMVALVAIALQTRRVVALEDTIAGAALLEVTLRPAILGGVGWWLSYAATLAIVRSLPLLSGRRWWTSAVAVSVIAQLATMAWALDAFGRVALLSPFTQLVLGPAFAFLLVVGMLGLLLAILLPAISSAILSLVILASHAFGWMVAQAHPYLSWPLVHPGLEDLDWAIALGIVGLGLWPGLSHARVRVTVMAILLLGVHLWPRGDHEWISFDVGQGDAGLYRCGERALLIDAGPMATGYVPAERSVAAYLLRRSVDDVDLLITHGHLDHSGGVAALLATGKVERVWVAASDSGQAWEKRISQAAARAGASMNYAARGDTIIVGHCKAAVLWPPAHEEIHEKNDRSLVLTLGPTGRELLATGDLERTVENHLLDDLRVLAPVAVLKVAHHGGNTGTDAAFLESLDAELALVSCGHGNRYGHPHPDCLARLRAAGLRILRTDKEGAVTLKWGPNGEEPTWSTASGSEGRGRP